MAVAAAVLAAAAVGGMHSPEGSEGRQAKGNSLPLRSHRMRAAAGRCHPLKGRVFPLQLICPGNIIIDPSRGTSFS